MPRSLFLYDDDQIEKLRERLEIPLNPNTGNVSRFVEFRDRREDFGRINAAFDGLVGFLDEFLASGQENFVDDELPREVCLEIASIRKVFPYLIRNLEWVYGLGPYTHAMTQEMIELEMELGEARFEAWERWDAGKTRAIVAEVATHIRVLEGWEPPESWRDKPWWEVSLGEPELKRLRRML